MNKVKLILDVAQLMLKVVQDLQSLCKVQGKSRRKAEAGTVRIQTSATSHRCGDRRDPRHHPGPYKMGKRDHSICH